MNEFTFERRKQYFFIIVIISILINAWWCYRDARYSLERGIRLSARASFESGLNDYKNHRFPNNEGHYLTGTQGELNWYPKTITEAVLLNTIAKDGTDLFDLATLLIISCAIMYNFKGSREGAIFTKRMNHGFAFIILALVIPESLWSLARLKIGHEYLPYVTNGAFTAIFTGRAPNNGLIIGILFFLTNIPYKGLEQQKEAELTI